MKIIQLSLILALISRIVTEDKYVVVKLKLPPGPLAERADGDNGAKGDGQIHGHIHGHLVG